MKYLIYIILIILICISILRAPAFSHLLINEIACGTSGEDWVELFYQSDEREELDISKLYITMYYGSNEPLSNDPVTIYSYDRPETPYDDRFIVVNLTNPTLPDETDITGDTNRNGYIDTYTNNYSGSLWNSDGVVAIDSDDDPANGGIIDFAAYSNQDGSPNDTIVSYVIHAQKLSHWQACTSENIQECMIDIGDNGLSSHTALVRKNTDSNSLNDFQTTRFQTPGKVNIFDNSSSSRKKLFKALKKKITIIPAHPVLGSGNIDLLIFEKCSIRFRIFSSIGMLIHETKLYRDIYPGKFTFNWNLRGAGRRACTGLYIGCIEAVSSSLKKSETELIYIIFSRYK